MNCMSCCCPQACAAFVFVPRLRAFEVADCVLFYYRRRVCASVYVICRDGVLLGAIAMRGRARSGLRLSSALIGCVVYCFCALCRNLCPQTI